MYSSCGYVAFFCVVAGLLQVVVRRLHNLHLPQAWTAYPRLVSTLRSDFPLNADCPAVRVGNCCSRFAHSARSAFAVATHLDDGAPDAHHDTMRIILDLCPIRHSLNTQIIIGVGLGVKKMCSDLIGGKNWIPRRVHQFAKRERE